MTTARKMNRASIRKTKSVSIWTVHFLKTRILVKLMSVIGMILIPNTRAAWIINANFIQMKWRAKRTLLVFGEVTIVMINFVRISTHKKNAL